MTMQNARSEADSYLLYPDCKLNMCTNSIQEKWNNSSCVCVSCGNKLQLNILFAKVWLVPFNFTSVLLLQYTSSSSSPSHSSHDLLFLLFAPAFSKKDLY